MTRSGVSRILLHVRRQTKPELLQAVIGMPCDPIPGGLAQPCRNRILMATCTAHIFADLALSGRDAVAPLHEVIDAADPAAC